MNKASSRIKSAWMTFARTLGRINSKIILSLFYILIIGIISLIRTPLEIFQKAPKSTWKEKSQEKITLERISSQS